MLKICILVRDYRIKAGGKNILAQLLASQKCNDSIPSLIIHALVILVRAQDVELADRPVPSTYPARK